MSSNYSCSNEIAFFWSGFLGKRQEDKKPSLIISKTKGGVPNPGMDPLSVYLFSFLFVKEKKFIYTYTHYLIILLYNFPLYLLHHPWKKGTFVSFWSALWCLNVSVCSSWSFSSINGPTQIWLKKWCSNSTLLILVWHS